jgi:hypothetical protein
MYDLYAKMPQTVGAYAAMALVGLGANVMADKTGMSICASVHGAEAEPATDYYVSRTAEWAHDHLISYAETQPTSRATEISRRAERVLAQAPAYTAQYHQARWGLFAAKCTMGALVNYSRTRNALGAVAYGLTQPAAVIAQDMKRRGRRP